MSRVTWDEQDCSEMPLLASEKIERLESENKASRKTISNLDCNLSMALDKIEGLKESRDDLLEALKLAKTLAEDGLPGQSFMRTAIQKAQDLKEKEA